MDGVPSSASFGTLIFTTYIKDGKMKPYTASLNTLHPASAKDKLLQPQRGDYLFIFKQNENDIQMNRLKQEWDLLRAWNRNRTAELHVRRKKLSAPAQEMLETNPQAFFYSFGFVKKKTPSSIPEGFFDCRGLSAKATRPVGDTPALNGFGLTADEVASKIVPARRDILHHFAVDMDDEEYESELWVGDKNMPIAFHGLQRGFTKDTWAELLQRGHHTLLIRPGSGLA